MDEFQVHRTARHDVVFGRRLVPGDVIQKDDVYESTTGKWEKAPCPGVVLEAGVETVWVRPEAEPK